MKFTTLAVGAGSCHVLETDDNQVWLFDCGSGGGRGPAQYLREQGKEKVDLLVVLNEDDDHLCGLAELIAEGLKPEKIMRNRTVDRTEWIRGKGGISSLSPSAAAWEDMVESYTADGGEPRSVNVQVRSMQNPWSKVNENTNNASLLVRLEVFGDAIILPGDLARISHQGG